MSKLTHDEMSRIGKSNVRRGKSLERRVAQLFSEWTGVEFRRRRVEGRDVTVIERESTADVIPVRGDIHFTIEVKCGIMTSFDGLLSDPLNNIFIKHWHQACYDASLVSIVFARKVYPFLFFKPHTNFDWIAISYNAFKDNILTFRSSEYSSDNNASINFPHLLFDACSYLGPISHNVSQTKKKANHVIVPLNLESIVLCRWKDFSKHVDPKSFFLSDLTLLQSHLNPLDDIKNV